MMFASMNLAAVDKSSDITSSSKKKCSSDISTILLNATPCPLGKLFNTNKVRSSGVPVLGPSCDDIIEGFVLSPRNKNINIKSRHLESTPLRSQAKSMVKEDGKDDEGIPTTQRRKRVLLSVKKDIFKAPPEPEKQDTKQTSNNEKIQTAERKERRKVQASVLDTAFNKVPKKGTLKRKNWIIDKLDEFNEGYDDDMFDDDELFSVNKIFESGRKAELTSEDVSFKFATPKRFTVFPNALSAPTPKFKKCVTPSEFTRNRNNATEYLYRREKMNKVKVKQQQSKPVPAVLKENVKGITMSEIKKTEKEVDKMMKCLPMENPEEFDADDIGDYYFSNDDSDIVYRNY